MGPGSEKIIKDLQSLDEKIKQIEIPDEPGNVEALRKHFKSMAMENERKRRIVDQIYDIFNRQRSIESTGDDVIKLKKLKSQFMVDMNLRGNRGEDMGIDQLME